MSQASRQPQLPQDPNSALQALIAQKKQLTVTDGSTQVVIAIASVTSLVTIDLTQHPPRITPPNLGTLAFNDNAVGISDDQMPMFKASLKVLLPTIASDIDQIPNIAAQVIGKVGEFVQLSLMSK
jgi:hypothetical protein